MWTISDVKAKGKSAFKANYGNSVVAALIASLFAGGSAAVSRYSNNQASGESGSSISIPADQAIALLVTLLTVFLASYAVLLVLKIFVFNPLKVGCYRFFRLNAENPGTSLSAIKEGFGDYGHTFCTLFLTDLFLALWSLLFIIPGLIKGYSYRMVPFILKDNPELSATEVITRSRMMMNGHKWNAFVLDLSFIGWFLLTIITCGIVGILWTNPYYSNTNAALYLELKKGTDTVA
ncbi:DUF975 family protein [Butyrivibrio sp. X503]|uniref:DUF975 family protein n=1 Tax=Butyrivibrio sp. X503 TaxID=2364878 RepID=UPI000EA8E740|nr:DUF975 family protein [Butyrivibrio sp. X503]RKM55224.1 DUF975 family protein [Butyrivibrio sp. X503]